MIGKMRNKTLPCIIMSCSFIAMLLIDIFALQMSSITLMLVAAVVGLAVFRMKKHPAKEGNAR